MGKGFLGGGEGWSGEFAVLTIKKGKRPNKTVLESAWGIGASNFSSFAKLVGR